MANSITRRQILKAGAIIVGAVATSQILAPGIQALAAPGRVGVSPALAPSLMSWSAANAILARVAPPVIRNRTFRITDHGAIGDDITDNTSAFQKAISACSQEGGGHVIVPAGTFMTGAIHLMSNVNLHLDSGATIKFSGDASKFPIVLTRYLGIELMNFSPMIYAHGQTNIAITGSGTLDAAATAAWNNTDNGSAWARLQADANAGVPVSQRVFGALGNRLRTTYIEPYSCTNVLIQGVTLKNAQFWQIHPTLCTNVTIDGVTTFAGMMGNSDSCDPESCDHVVIKNCSFTSLDDAIAIKSGRGADGRRLSTPSQNIVIIHCQFQSSKGMVACGSEESGGVQNVFADDLSAFGSGVRYCLYLKANMQHGGYVKNIHLNKVTASGVAGSALFATLNYPGGNGGSFPPSFDNININNMTVDGAPFVLDVTGVPSDKIGTISLANSTFTHIAQPEGIIKDVRKVTYTNVTINGKPVH